MVTKSIDGPVQSAFIKSTITDMEVIRPMYRNHTAIRTIPSLDIYKPGTEELRFTVFLVDSNA